MKAGYKKTSPKVANVKGYAMPAEDMRPRLSLDSNTLPDVKNWKVGKTYTVILELKQTGLHEQYGGTGLCADFEVIGARPESKT